MSRTSSSQRLFRRSGSVSVLFFSRVSVSQINISSKTNLKLTTPLSGPFDANPDASTLIFRWGSSAQPILLPPTDQNLPISSPSMDVTLSKNIGVPIMCSAVNVKTGWMGFVGTLVGLGGGASMMRTSFRSSCACRFNASECLGSNSTITHASSNPGGVSVRLSS